jgi:aspartyl-tRNA(Asn)/glutamyl-tRNA(Gln) amidotransferase subunit C
MPITKKDVEYAARLARLRLSEAEREQFASQLAKIVGYVEKLNELDTKGVEPTAHVLPLKNVTRPDEVKPSINRERILKLAPKTADGLIMVPRVIE